MPNYPVSLDTFTTKQDNVDDILAAHMNAVQSAIVAVETELGLGLRGAVADLATRLAVSLNNDGTVKTSAIIPGAASIINSMIAAGAVTTGSILDGTITGADIASATIAGSNLQNATIAQTQMANLSIGTAQLIDGAVTQAKHGVGSVYPDNLGLNAWNATGSTITAGQTVYVSGYNVANSLPQISLAINNLAGQAATYIATASIANGAAGVVRRHWTSAANLNTNAASGVGAAIYSDSVAGGWTVTAPTAASSRVQIIGRVVVKDAAVGQIEFDLTGSTVAVVGSVDIQTGSVSATQLDANRNVYRTQGFLGTIPTTGTVECPILIPAGGTLTGFKLISQDALVGSDSNFFTVSVVDKSTDGSGNTQMDVGTASDTTKITGGTNGVVAYASTNFGVNGGAVSGNQVLKVLVTVSGTLPNTLRNCLVSATILLSP